MANFENKVTASTTSQELIPSGEFNQFARVVNEGPVDVYLKKNIPATTSVYTEKLPAYAWVEYDNELGDGTSIHVITVSGTSVVTSESY